MQEQLTRRMAGEIVVSEKPGDTLRKWREIFQLSQKELATLLEVNPSVVCDFEKGRRASPGIGTVRKFVEAMVDYDSSHGGKVVNTMAGTRTNEAIVDIREFTSGIAIETIIEKIEGEVLAGSEEIIERPIYGYTMVDSLKAITTFNAFGEMYGWSNERAVFFSGVHYGRSPMIAVRAHPVKPRMVVYVKPKAIDPLAPKLADMERVVLVKTDLDESAIVEKLRYLR
ncbi:MAG: transcriptional regulator [Candidatus Thermoplasmatota archaeon]|nr:transcriptional regulator [Candidatus Thermoplasmatota archaeon]MED6305639.1 transcriptional regulator [Candidatus Thermoplasmatota archaeon]